MCCPWNRRVRSNLVETDWCRTKSCIAKKPLCSLQNLCSNIKYNKPQDALKAGIFQVKHRLSDAQTHPVTQLNAHCLLVSVRCVWAQPIFSLWALPSISWTVTLPEASVTPCKAGVRHFFTPHWLYLSALLVPSHTDSPVPYSVKQCLFIPHSSAPHVFSHQQLEVRSKSSVEDQETDVTCLLSLSPVSWLKLWVYILLYHGDQEQVFLFFFSSFFFFLVVEGSWLMVADTDKLIGKLHQCCTAIWGEQKQSGSAALQPDFICQM